MPKLPKLVPNMNEMEWIRISRVCCRVDGLVANLITLLCVCYARQIHLIEK